MPEWLKRLVAPSIFEDEEKTRTARILNSIGWAALFILLPLIILMFLGGEFSDPIARTFFLLLLVVLLITQVMLRYGYVKSAGGFLIVFIWIALTAQAYHAHGLHDAAILAYPIVILLTALLLGWQAGLLSGLLSIAMLWFFAIQKYQGLGGHNTDEPLSYARDATVIFIISSILTYQLIYRINRSLSDARMELQERLRADEKLQIQARYLSALHETALGLINRLELNPLLELILTRTSELLDTPNVDIDLVTPDEDALFQELGYGVYAQWNGSYTEKGVGLTGKVWEEGKTIFAEDYDEFPNRHPSALNSSLGTVIGTPLQTQGKVIGTLLISYTDKHKKVTPDQILLLERLAALASLAIDNARLYENAQTEIIERKIIEQELRSSEGRFRKVFENNKIAITIVTLNRGVFLEANEAFWNLSKLSPEKALGRAMTDFQIFGNPVKRESFVESLLKKGSLQNVQVEFPGENGNNRFALGYYELIDIKEKQCILCMFYDITEQNQTQRDLRESEERFRTIFNASPVAISITTLEDGRYLDANEAYWKLTGYEPDLFLGNQTINLGIWSDPQERVSFVETLKEKHRLVDPNYMIYNQPNQKMHTAIGLAELIELRGESCILSVFYDITEQKQAESALQNAERRTRAILSSIPDLIFETSRAGIFLDFLTSTQLVPVMKPHQFIGKNMHDLFPPNIAEQALGAIERALSSDQIQTFEYGLPPEEEIQFFEARVTPVSQDTALVMVRDISQRKWVETEREKLIHELEAKNDESETLRESMAIIVETLDETKAISLILEQLEKVVPYDSASVQLLRDDTLEIVSTRRIEPAEIVGLKYRVDKNDPSYPLIMGQVPYILIEDIQTDSALIWKGAMSKEVRAWLAIPLRVKGRILGIIALDGYIAGQFNRKDAEHALTYANQVTIALENARLFSEAQDELFERTKLIQELEIKNAELERFTYTVSHDLKSPIITIRGFLGFLEQDAVNGNQTRLRSDIKRISDATEKMQSLLNDLLELSRVGRLVNPPTVVSFNELVHETLEIVQGQIQKNMIQISIQEKMPAVYVDRPRVIEALQNLIDNAAKFIGENPRIEIGQNGMENDMPIFHVRDNGIGIAPEHHDRIFGLFNKLDIDSEGTGVGLALVKRIIEIHKGRIWVQSEPDKGSTFYFTLPAPPPNPKPES